MLTRGYSDKKWLAQIWLVPGVTLGCLLLMSLQGCILAPIVEGVRQSGVTSGDRMGLLSERVKKFNESLGWKDNNRTLRFVTDEGRPAVLEQLRAADGDEHIVESRIVYSDFSNDSWEADVQVAVKYYRVPYYIVKERREDQHWKFSLSDGWKLDSRKLEQK